MEYLELPKRPQPFLEKVVIWLPEAEGKDWPEEICKLKTALEEVSVIAVEQGVTVITKVVDDLQWGISKYPGEEDARTSGEEAGSEQDEAEPREGNTESEDGKAAFGDHEGQVMFA